MEEFERHLRSMCADDSRLKLLEAQWEYDKRLLGQALQAVGSTFPHYSLHDASHSNTILVNLARVLGPRIEQLSATDTWLILEAAYWHDVGMIVSDHKLREWWKSPDFLQHLERLQHSPDPVLASSARAVLNKNDSLLESDFWPIDVKQALTFVVADYARTKHADRAFDAIRNPLGFSIDSPRALIPARLFDWLAKICSAHGQSRTQVLALPTSENGIGPDQCNPRFVAFMLRLGDLLDLDNGRFCPVLLAQVNRIPPSSGDHIAKHASISRYHVSPTRIDVEATVFSPSRSAGESQRDPHLQSDETDVHGAYHAISQWLEWLREELTFLAVNWSEIAPSNLDGGSPSIGVIQATLSGFELIPDGRTSDISVDSEYFLELSKSNGLFGSPDQAWQRELVANAVDATLIHLWQLLDDREREVLRRAVDPLTELRKYTANLPIAIEVLRRESETEAGRYTWTVSIADCGCGMDLAGIRALQVVGSSKKNHSRRQIAAAMPEFMRPTGSFGLGFQSVFLDTDKVDIETHHGETAVSRRISIVRPSRPEKSGHRAERPGVYIRRVSDSPARRKSGTRITFLVARPTSFGATHVDPIRESDSTLGGWPEQLEQACRLLPVPVLLNGKTINAAPASEGLRYFDSTTSMLVSFQDAQTAERHQSIVRAYRGSPVTSYEANTTVLGYVADLWALSASDVLQVNRTAFTDAGTRVFDQRLEAAMPRALEAYLADCRKQGGTSQATQRASLFARFKYSIMSVRDSEWMDLLLPVLISKSTGLPETVSIRQLLDLPKAHLLLMHRGGWFGRPMPQRSVQLEKDTFLVPALGNDLLLAAIASRFSGGISLLDTVGPFSFNGPMNDYWDLFHLAKEPVATRVERSAFDFSLTPTYSGRPTFPCPAEFDDLTVEASANGWMDNYRWAAFPRILSPFVFDVPPFSNPARVSIPAIEKYLEYVWNKRREKATNRAEIVDATVRLLQRGDAVFRTVSWVECNYDLDREVQTLSRLA